MKSNRTHQYPPVIENLGDGTFYHNFNVVESTVEEEEGGQAAFKSYDYDQVRCNYPVEVAKIQACVDKEGYVYQVDLSGYDEI